MENNFKNIVSTSWLEKHLEAPDIRIIDSSWYFPHEKRNAEQEFIECHTFQVHLSLISTK